jgi:hypothetical protein
VPAAGRDDRYRQTMPELVAAIGCSAILVPAARAGTIRAAGGRHWLFRHPLPAARAGTIRAARYLRRAKHGLGRSKPDRGAVPPASAGERCG